MEGESGRQGRSGAGTAVKKPVPDSTFEPFNQQSRGATQPAARLYARRRLQLVALQVD